MTDKYKPQVPSIIDDFQKSGDTYSNLRFSLGQENLSSVGNALKY